MTGSTCHKANGTITTLVLDNNKIAVEGAIALANALKANFAMCFSRCYKHVLLAVMGAVSRLQPSLSWGTNKVNFDVRELDVLCVARFRCGVRCDSSSLHRAFANMHSQVSFLHGRSPRYSCLCG